MTDLLVIRPSSLADWLDCRRRYAARHLKDLLAAAGYTVAPPRPAHVGAAVGTGLHSGAAHVLITRMQTGTDPSDGAAESIAIEQMRLRMGEDGCDWDDTTRDINTAEKQLRRMLQSWRRHVAPQIHPQLVEERLEVMVADGIAMSGQLDLADTVGNALRVRDNKTTKQRRAAHAQLGAYGLLLNSHSYEVAGLAIDHVPRVALRDEQPKPETREIPLRAAVEDAMQCVEEIGRDVAEFRRRAANPHGRDPIAAFPANPASSLCNARFCPAWGTNACRVHV